MSRLFDDIIEGFKEIGELENNQELIDAANSILDNKINESTEGDKINMEKINRPINIRKELIELDKLEDSFGDLTDLYDMVSLDLTQEDKQKLVNLINSKDVNAISELLFKIQDRIENKRTSEDPEIKDLDTIYKDDDLLDEDIDDDWENADDLTLVRSSISDELDEILYDQSEGSLETSDEDVKYEVLKELDRRGYDYEVSANDLSGKYHIEFWK